jgi:hypothetical protein
LRTMLHLRFQRYEVLHWNESSTEGCVHPFHTRASALDFLRPFLRDSISMMSIRRLIGEISSYGNVSRLSDQQVLEQFAWQLVLGRFRIAVLPLFTMGSQASESFEESFAEPFIEPPKRKPEPVFSKQKKAWIEIELLDDKNRPVAEEPYRIILPDNQTIREGRTNSKGMARETDIDPGTCRVTFPNLEKDAWARA